MLAPSALIMADQTEHCVDAERTLQQCGRRYLLIKTRKRITRDGGASVLVVE